MGNKPFSGKYSLAGNGSGIDRDCHHSHSCGHGFTGSAQLLWPIDLTDLRMVNPSHAFVDGRLNGVNQRINADHCHRRLLVWK
ncbi:hypothetical protein [Synechococcus sp. BIOS-E4-1]|uniref:hypothetical protein n=1 Tax=Synechococcus sp. BIOS-E4-1 TaxID=1400864 RepID=UPI001646D459|nr:hypothetical protein [Synechococcus sp. BIOS-E4-1]